MKEFKLNEYITLKLENNETNIYFKGEDTPFNQCKSILLRRPVNEIKSLPEIESIDELAEIKEEFLETEQPKLDEISPETEFWGHSSSLQAWEENNYDTRLLHSNLAFPLLKKLTVVGDSKAKKVFKEEIAKRLNNNYLPVILFLLEEDYLNYLTEEELSSIIDPSSNSFIEKIIKSNLELSKIESFITIIKDKLPINFKRKIKKIFQDNNYEIIGYLFYTDIIYIIEPLINTIIEDSKNNFFETLVNTIRYFRNNSNIDENSLFNKIDNYFNYFNTKSILPVKRCIINSLKDNNFDAIALITQLNLLSFFKTDELFELCKKNNIDLIEILLKSKELHKISLFINKDEHAYAFTIIDTIIDDFKKYPINFFFKKFAEDPYYFDEKEIQNLIKMYGQEIIDFLMEYVFVQLNSDYVLNDKIITILTNLNEPIKQKVKNLIKSNLSRLNFYGDDRFFNISIFVIHDLFGSETLLQWLDTFDDLNLIYIDKSDFPGPPAVIEVINRAISNGLTSENIQTNKIAKNIEKKLNNYFKHFC